MKLLQLTGLLILLVVTVSCDPAKEFAAEIEEIDSCITSIEEMEGRLEGIKFDSLIIMVDHVILNEERIKMYYKPDTLNQELGSLMNESKGIRKKMSNLKGKKSYFSDEMNAIKQQLSDLKTDISNGIFNKERIDKYLAKEKKDLEVLSLTFNEFYDLQEQQSRVYYYAVPKIDAYIKQMKAESDTLPQ